MTARIDNETIETFMTAFRRAGGDDPAAFGTAFAATGLSGRDGYVALRDALRMELRAMADAQRSARRREVELRDLARNGDASCADARETVYRARMRKRYAITSAIAARRAGKAWSAAEAKAASLALTQA